MKGIIRAAIATALAAAGAYAEDIDFPSDATLTFSGGTEYVESSDSTWDTVPSEVLNISVTGTGNSITRTHTNNDNQPWRKVKITGSGYLTFKGPNRWTFAYNDGTDLTGFSGTAHFELSNNVDWYGVADAGARSMQTMALVFEPLNSTTHHTIYFSNNWGESNRYFGDLRTEGDYGNRIDICSKTGVGDFYVGYLNRDSTFAGKFVHNSDYGIVKVGTGTWTLTGDIGMHRPFVVRQGTVVFNNNTVACSVSVESGAKLGGNGTISGAVSAASGAQLLFDADNVLTFTDAANLNGFTVDATGCTAENEYLVAKGTTSLPGVSAAQTALGWMTEAKGGNVYLVNRMTVIDANVTLDADADWTATPVSVADNVTIDLNGHNLSVAGITLGSGVAFVNNGAEKSRLYAGLNGGDKSWLLELNLPSKIMPVFCGAAIEIPSTYVPAGGIGFKDTAGAMAQTVSYESCANGFEFLGNANITEPFKSWQNGSFPIAIYGEGNVFTFYADNSWSKDGSFAGKSLSGDGTLTLASTDGIRTAFLIGSESVDNSGLTGRLVLKWGANFGQAIEFGDPKTQNNKHFPNASVVLCGKDNGSESQFLLSSGNGSSTANFCFDSLETEGVNASKVILSTSCGSSGGTNLRIGTNNGGSGIFAGTFTNYNGDAERPYNIVKNGTGTWTLTGTVANGGTFTVAAGGVEFRGGLANVSSLTVASGASVLFAGDMGSNPISLASGSTLKLDASNTGDDVPVVKGNLDLTGVNVYVSQGTYVPSKTEPRELLRVTGSIIGFNRNGVSADIDARGWSFRLVANEDGSKSIVHRRNPSFSVSLR